MKLFPRCQRRRTNCGAGTEAPICGYEYVGGFEQILSIATAFALSTEVTYPPPVPYLHIAGVSGGKEKVPFALIVGLHGHFRGHKAYTADWSFVGYDVGQNVESVGPL